MSFIKHEICTGSKRAMHTNRKAFSPFLKVSKDICADYRSTGKLFHTREPSPEKLLL